MKVKESVKFILKQEEVQTIEDFMFVVRNVCNSLRNLSCSLCPYYKICSKKTTDAIQIMLDAAGQDGLVEIED